MYLTLVALAEPHPIRCDSSPSLATLEDRRSVFSFSLAPLGEIFRTEEIHICGLKFFEASSIRRVIDNQARRFQRGLDAKGAAGGDSVGYADRDFDGGGFIGSNLLNDAHPICSLRVPGIAGEQVAHGIGPTDLSWPADRCDARNRP